MAKVILYTTPTCGWCKLTKEFFRKRGVRYQEIDVSENHQAAHKMVEKSGQFGVPVIDIDGKIVIGFNPLAIEEALTVGV